MQKMIRLNETASNQLDDLSKETGQSKQELLAVAVDMLIRKYFLEKANKELAELKKNPKEWQEYLDEHEAWDSTLLDGLEDFKYED